MSYFDSKEELLSIELTSYGRRCLLEGKFKPSYYSFHDDDVIYNVEFSGLTEKTAESFPRITEETPYLKTNTRKKSIDATIKQAEPQEKDAYELSSLGRAAFGAQKAPAWSLRVLEGQIESMAKTYSHKTLGEIQIPQVNIQPVFTKTKLVKQQDISPGYRNITFNDGMVLEFEEKGLILDLEELNVDSMTGDFELEIYEVLNENNNELLKEIHFLKEAEIIKNNILLDSDADDGVDKPRAGNTADNYFFITTDDTVVSSVPEMQLTEVTKPMKKAPFGEDC